MQRTTTQKAPVQKATAQKATAPTEKTHRTAKATAAHRSTVQTSAKQFAYDAEFESADPARLFSAPATGTFEGQRETGERDELRVAQYGFSSFTAAQDDDGDHRAETFSVMGAMTTTTTWASTSTRSWSTSPKSWSTEAKNAFRGASHHAHRGDRHHSRDDRSDNGRHRGHDRFVAAGHGQHRAAPAPVVRAEHGTSNAVASSWTRAVVGHHADVTAVAAPSTAPSDADAPAPSDDTSADTAFPAPFTPAAPSTTTASGGSTPIAVAAGVTDEMPIHEGTPVHAAEATQSVVPLAPVFTTDVSPD